MAMLAIQISPDISRLFRQIELDANRDPSDHITMFYLGDDFNMKQILKIIPTIYEISSTLQPFEVSCSKITCFPEGKYGFPVIAEIKSEDLIELRNKIEKAFGKNKIKFDTKFKEYKPHVTLGYAKEKVKDAKINKIKWAVSQISLYCGDEADSKLFVNFPFNLGIDKIASFSECFSQLIVKS